MLTFQTLMSPLTSPALVQWVLCFDGADLSADEKNQSMGLMRGAFKSAKLDGSSFKRANLARAMMEFASLRGADLSGANLRGGEFAAADFSDANVAGTNFDGAGGRSRSSHFTLW